ncbi:MAG: hypothetical protein FWC00_01090 [Firmicutes bacterium]|nr:hypothetical protein [Bacillota bacterium]MCL2228406.1 hypothetical protein [Bacillota bacterium]
MRKKNPRYKEYLRRKSRKKGVRKAERRYHKPCTSRKKEAIKIKKYKKTDRCHLQKIKEKSFSLPEDFSLLSNPEDVKSTFHCIREFMIANRGLRMKIKIDARNIKNATADAVMYLLAMLRDKRNQNEGIRWSGDLPLVDGARRVFMESGFLSYVNSLNNIIKNADKVAIKNGKEVKSDLAKAICDWVIDKIGCTRNETKFLQKTIVELMENTKAHAYTDDTDLLKDWYLFVEKRSSKFEFVFLDTGGSIPSTIKKRFGEKVFGARQVDLIESALEGGEFRSTTKLKHRNKGLPNIKQKIEYGHIKSMVILSNRAKCELYKENNNLVIKKDEQKNKLYGTLYYWEVDTVKLKGEAC